MARLRIHCCACGQNWEVYDSRNFTDEENRRCPCCGKSIDPQTWENQLLPALGVVSDGNRELYKDHTGQHCPLFYFDVIADRIPANKEKRKTWAEVSGIE